MLFFVTFPVKGGEMSRLDRCPFCGCMKFVIENFVSNGEWISKIKYVLCRATGPEREGGEREATVAWNTRSYCHD